MGAKPGSTVRAEVHAAKTVQHCGECTAAHMMALPTTSGLLVHFSN
jgi:hypothetical protein